MTALPLSTRTGWFDRAVLRIGRALTDWATEHSALHTAPDYAEQVRRIEHSRDAAAGEALRLTR
ncbi:hypothetical protein [Leifsonia poae]|uniref:hypothetical protein n=1 Tax=Leifsonia poae TaxID=110933 RepID=UPI001CC09D44|nr:hypothetical protein [Leifsonia poae]